MKKLLLVALYAVVLVSLWTAAIVALQRPAPPPPLLPECYIVSPYTKSANPINFCAPQPTQTG